MIMNLAQDKVLNPRHIHLALQMRAHPDNPHERSQYRVVAMPVDSFAVHMGEPLTAWLSDRDQAVRTMQQYGRMITP